MHYIKIYYCWTGYLDWDLDKVWVKSKKNLDSIRIKKHGQYQHDLLDRISELLEHIAKKNKKNIMPVGS